MNTEGLRACFENLNSALSSARRAINRRFSSKSMTRGSLLVNIFMMAFKLGKLGVIATNKTREIHISARQRQRMNAAEQ